MATKVFTLQASKKCCCHLIYCYTERPELQRVVGAVASNGKGGMRDDIAIYRDQLKRINYFSLCDVTGVRKRANLMSSLSTTNTSFL